ncbi:MAG: phosphatidate cytidylyltransferase [Planctomycetaceae bacterium]
MLFWRLVFGPILIAAFVALLWADLRLGPRAPLLALLVLSISLRMCWEYVSLLNVRTFRLDWRVLAALAGGVVLANWIPLAGPLGSATTEPGAPGPGLGLARLGPSMVILGLAQMVLFIRAMFRFREPGNTLENLGAEFLGLGYVAVFASCTAQLRWVGEGLLAYVPLASLVVTVKCGDTSAYFVGRAVGGRKMAPLISPGKTVAGGIAAIVGGMLGGWLWLRYAIPALTGQAAGPAWALAIYGALIAAAGLLGDLAESLIKRDVGQKDAPALFPGFGGLLDIVDSVLFCGPLALLLWNLLPLLSSGPDGPPLKY